MLLVGWNPSKNIHLEDQEGVVKITLIWIFGREVVRVGRGWVVF
jgi:hypothetical protein